MGLVAGDGKTMWGCAQGCLPSLPIGQRSCQERWLVQIAGQCQGVGWRKAISGTSCEDEGLNPRRSVSLHQVRTSPAQECWLCHGTDPWFQGALLNQGCFKKRMGQSCPWETWRQASVAIQFLLRRGLLSLWISAPASRAVNTITAHKTTQLSSEFCSNT